MTKNSVIYAVVAPKLDDVSRLTSRIREQGEEGLAAWVEANGEKVYGTSAEKWTPFLGDTIEELVSRTGLEVLSLTESLEKAVADPAKASSVTDTVDVYFIDLLAFYMNRFHRLAEPFDHVLSKGFFGKCCFLVCYKLDPALQDRLVLYMQKTWCNVCDSYKKGSLDRIAAREEDVFNFLGLLTGKLSSLTGPPAAAAGMATVHFDGDNCGRGDRPTLGSGRVR